MKTLKTVPMLKNLDEKVLIMMCDYLKPVVYNENSFVFRMGDPLDCMLFIVEGTMWTYYSPSTSDTDTTSEAAATSPSSILMTTKALRKGEFYGEELLKWGSPTFTTLPISTRHVRSQRKVEAFALMADDLATIVSKCQLQWDLNNCDNPQEMKIMAVSSITKAIRRFRTSRHRSTTERLLEEVIGEKVG
ncbi:hypothetical protein L3X38_015098 [Prunus dulcis]|uniref:Cyclic nucleotide-binding domain-containing protein n=1 Tax=Prunus dulcis TaxID=3755 RepID=A0AAD4WPM2_PRUDU|nr:hypothetical protein L3X38_015098 [Prunus dulcis]